MKKTAKKRYKKKKVNAFFICSYTVFVLTVHVQNDCLLAKCQSDSSFELTESEKAARSATSTF